MNLKFNAGWVYGLGVVLLAAWVLHGFAQALLAASVAAIASWPLYKRFRARLQRRRLGHVAPLLFTCLMTLFVLTPMLMAFGALLTEGHGLLVSLAAADGRGMPAPAWLEEVPLAGPWLASSWGSELAHPGALSIWARRAEPAALIGLAQSLGQFAFRHLFIVAFTVLVLLFLYQEGDTLRLQFARMLRYLVGERAERHLDVATRAVRAAVNSMLLVGLFDGVASWCVYALAGVPHAALWAAITGALALVPLLGYVAVAALTLKLAMMGAAPPPLLALGLGCAVLFVGDKIVRPVVASGGTRLPFVWVLMGCLGGFEAFGLVGVVVGPVVLSLARALWEQRGFPLPERSDTRPSAR